MSSVLNKKISYYIQKVQNRYRNDNNACDGSDGGCGCGCGYDSNSSGCDNYDERKEGKRTQDASARAVSLTTSQCSHEISSISSHQLSTLRLAN